MRIAIIGAGPAGLYLAYLIKRRDPRAEVTVSEQNAPDATFGFGVVFSDRALEFLRDDDPETHAAIVPHMESWRDIAVVHRGERIVIDGVGFAAIGRLKLLRLLQARARSVGVEPRYGRAIGDLADIEADLIVGADGVNSLVRRSDEKAFGTRITLLTNRFAWFGTTKRFDTLTQTFVQTDLGHFNAHHYRHSPELSTFVVEVDEATFTRSDLERMGNEQSRKFCETIFAQTLDGHVLVSNNSVWRQFPIVHNERWSAGNRVLIGDALHTAHFSIGSGTRLAMEDAIALEKALAANPGHLDRALSAYENVRRPVLEKLVAGANGSAAWYQHFAEHMLRPPVEFAMSYIIRSGRVDLERLRALSPAFVERFEAECGRSSGGSAASVNNS
ncbi:MAG TPA: FAD-dependent monooxygenase [Pseudolabrys sp.]|nr:FAD-dependent monooxygenase [Pseudolabrys sp.]